MQISAAGISNEWCHLNWSLLLHLYVANIINSYALDQEFEQISICDECRYARTNMVIVFYLIGKAQRFANCKICTSFTLFCYSACPSDFTKTLLLVVKYRYYAAQRVISQKLGLWLLFGHWRYRVQKKKEKRKETHKNKVVPDMPSHMFNEFSLFGK